MSEQRPLIVALDHDRADTALELAMRLDPGECRLKIAGTLFVRAGPPLVERLTARGFDVFLDLKFHDIPAQVAGACRSAADLGVWMLNVHAAGGAAMMRAALDALSGSPRPPLLTAVTVLTSLDGADLATLGLEGPPAEAALRLARLARAAGLDGVVCSAEDLGRLRPELPEPFLMVTPGIRPGEGRIDADDQKRVSTPRAALAAGASYLVVGRPVTRAGDPMAAVAAINAEIRGVTRAP